MNYLALLKELQKNGPGTALTEPPKPGSVGFVSSHPPPFFLESETEKHPHINDGAQLGHTESAETASEAQQGIENEPEKGTPPALTKPTEPGFVSSVSTTPQAAEPTKPTGQGAELGFVGFVATLPPPSQTIEASEAANDTGPATGPDRWCWPHSPAMNTGEIEAFRERVTRFMSQGEAEGSAERRAEQLMQQERLAPTLAARSGITDQAGAASRQPQTILQRQEEAALVWLRRYLQWDIAPLGAIRADAKAAGVSWNVLLRIAGDRVIVSRCGGYWKLPKPPRWTPEMPVEQEAYTAPLRFTQAGTSPGGEVQQ